MDKNVFSNIVILICLVFVQVLVCNNIMLFNVAMAFVFIYVIIRLPMDLNVNWLLTWALSTLGFAVYGKYLFSMVTVYCLLAFTIEYFNFADVKEIVIMSAASALLTFLILLGVDSLMARKDY